MVQFIRKPGTATDDWVTDRAPTMADTHDAANQCVECTYINLPLGWEPVANMARWPDVSSIHHRNIIAWRRIRPAYRPDGER